MKDQDNLAELGSHISLCSFYFIELAFGFTQFFTLSASFAEMFSHTARLAQMKDVIEELNEKNKQSKKLIVSQTKISNIDGEGDGDGDGNDGEDEIQVTSSTEDDVQLIIPLSGSFPNNDLIFETKKVEPSYNQYNLNNKNSENNLENETIPNKFTKIKIVNNAIKFINVDCYTPDNHLLVRNLSFSVSKPSESLLITGSSGTGKTSVIRILGGLWKGRSGIIKRPKISTKTIMILCQQPYIPIATLRGQITYPEIAAKEIKTTELMTEQEDKGDQKIEKILRFVGLGHLIDQKINSGKCDTVNEVLSSYGNFNSSLSPGEKQRISFGRIIYHKPRFAILDESTSALETDVEKKIYLMLRELGIILISIGHRDSLDEFHDQKIILSRGGGWELEQKY
ncbi:atp-binding cassette [Anaeramoeba flamelloides]|uniref:Atp-binding cassette n=1 Tax=Anaeramoeba flamelloides TaxID=1746091 RepID=A0ABQ8Z4Q7_9EUKA|nr:atp-binding cassette [Anaeramoeba flamelloides]